MMRGMNTSPMWKHPKSFNEHASIIATEYMDHIKFDKMSHAHGYAIIVVAAALLRAPMQPVPRPPVSLRRSGVVRIFRTNKRPANTVKQSSIKDNSDSSKYISVNIKNARQQKVNSVRPKSQNPPSLNSMSVEAAAGVASEVVVPGILPVWVSVVWLILQCPFPFLHLVHQL